MNKRAPFKCNHCSTAEPVRNVQPYVPHPGDAGGERADHQDAVQQAHLPGAVQEQSQRPELQRDPQAAADGAAAPRGDSGSARSVSPITLSSLLAYQLCFSTGRNVDVISATAASAFHPHEASRLFSTSLSLNSEATSMTVQGSAYRLKCT